MEGRDPSAQKLLRLLREVQQSRSVGEAGEAALRYAMSKIPQAQAGALLLLNQRRGCFEFRAAVGWDPAKLSRVAIPQERILQRQLHEDRPALVRNPLEHNRKYLGEELAQALAEVGPCAAFLSFPIREGSQVIGYFNLDHHSDPEAFDQADLEVLNEVGEAVGLVIRAAWAWEQMAERESMLRSIFERLPYAAYLVDLEGKVLAANPAAAHQTGYTLQELQQMNLWQELLQAPGAWSSRELIGRLRQGAEVVETKKRRRDGHVFWAEGILVLTTFRGAPAVLALFRDIVDRKRLEEIDRIRKQILEAVAYAAAQFLAHPTLEEAVPPVLARLGQAVEVSRVYIFQNHVDAQGRLLTSQKFEWVAPGVTPTIDNPNLQDFPYLEMGFHRWLEIFARKEVVQGLVRQFPPPERAVLEPQGIVALLCVPIHVHGKFWGFIGFDECFRERAWGSAEIDVLRALADLFGALVERLSAEAELRSLHEVTTQVASTLDLESVFGKIHHHVERLVPCDAFVLALVDPQGEQFELAYAVERGKKLPRLHFPLDPQRSLVAWVATSGKPLAIHDYPAEKDQLPTKVQQVGEEVASWFGVPLVFQEKVLGVLSVQSFRPHAFDEDDMRLLQTLAASVSLAVHNAQAYRGLKRLTEKLGAVEEAGRRMRLAQTRSELYELALHAATSILGYSRVSVLEVQGDNLLVVHQKGYGLSGESLVLPLSGKGLTVAAYKAEQEIYAPDVTQDPRYVPAAPETRSELVLPLRVGEKLVAVMNVEHSWVDGIPPDDRELLRILAAELSVAMEGLARLHQREALSQKLAALHEVSPRLQRCSTVQEVFSVACQAAVELLKYWNVVIGLEQGEFVVPVAMAGELAHKARPLRKGEGMAGMTWLTGAARWGKLSDFPEARPVDPRIKAVISVPIGKRGVIQLLATREDAFNKDDLYLVEILARHVDEEIRRVELEAELREQAIRDPLTGLYNRRFLSEVLQRELDRARRYEKPFALLFVDVDGFREVNNRYGHLKGDEVLKSVSQILLRNVRSSDIVFRYGGDEFVILLLESNGRAARVADRLKAEVAEWNAQSGLEVPVGLSIGMSLFHPQDPCTVDELLHQADVYLYKEKGEKRGTS